MIEPTELEKKVAALKGEIGRVEIPTGPRGVLAPNSFAAGGNILAPRAPLPLGPAGPMNPRSFSAIQSKPEPVVPAGNFPGALIMEEEKLDPMQGEMKRMRARVEALERQQVEASPLDDIPGGPSLHFFPPYVTVFSAQPYSWSPSGNLYWGYGPYLNDPITSPDDRCIRLGAPGDALIQITRPGKYLVLFHAELTWARTYPVTAPMDCTVMFEFRTASGAKIYPECGVNFHLDVPADLQLQDTSFTLREHCGMNWVLDWEDHIVNNEFYIYGSKTGDSGPGIEVPATRLIIIGPFIHAPPYI